MSANAQPGLVLPGSATDIGSGIILCVYVCVHVIPLRARCPVDCAGKWPMEDPYPRKDEDYYESSGSMEPIVDDETTMLFRGLEHELQIMIQRYHVPPEDLEQLFQVRVWLLSWQWCSLIALITDPQNVN